MCTLWCSVPPILPGTTKIYSSESRIKEKQQPPSREPFLIGAHCALNTHKAHGTHCGLLLFAFLPLPPLLLLLLLFALSIPIFLLFANVDCKFLAETLWSPLRLTKPNQTRRTVDELTAPSSHTHNFQWADALYSQYCLTAAAVFPSKNIFFDCVALLDLMTALAHQLSIFKICKLWQLFYNF